MALIILVFGFVFACIASWYVPATPGRPHFGWLALACFILYFIVEGGSKFLGVR